MPADLVLIDGLPGGPYRLAVRTDADGTPELMAMAMCMCTATTGPSAGGPHWCPRASADTLPELYSELLRLWLSAPEVLS